MMLLCQDAYLCMQAQLHANILMAARDDLPIAALSMLCWNNAVTTCVVTRLICLLNFLSCRFIILSCMVTMAIYKSVLG
jgi:hypothetical protein